MAVSSKYSPILSDGTLKETCFSVSLMLNNAFNSNWSNLGNLSWDTVSSENVGAVGLTVCTILLPLPGYMVVPAGGGGTFLGGYIVKRLNLRCRGIIRFCMVCAMISLLAIFIFLINCPNMPMAGVTAPYQSGLMGELRLDQYKHLYDKPSKLRLRNRWAVFVCVSASCWFSFSLSLLAKMFVSLITHYSFDYC